MTDGDDEQAKDGAVIPDDGSDLQEKQDSLLALVDSHRASGPFLG